jgi:predicted secreted protein
MSSPAPGTTATGHLTRPHATRRRSRTHGPGRHASPWALAAVALTAAACATQSPSLPPDRTATPTSTAPTAAPAHAADDKPSHRPGRLAVDAAYRRFWDVAQTLDQHPEGQWRTRLSQVAAEPALTSILDGLHSRTQAGYRQYGAVTPRPTILDLGPDRASILDCQDASRTGEIDTTTGLATNPGHARTPVTASLTRDADGRWHVADARYLDGDC